MSVQARAKALPALATETPTPSHPQGHSGGWPGAKRKRGSTTRQPLRRCRSALDGLADADVGAAAAYVAGHRRVYVGIVGVRVCSQQSRRRHDLSRLAVAALNDLVIEPGLLHLGAGCG